MFGCASVLHEVCIKGARAPASQGRWGLPREWASLALELIKNKMINGETIRIDGGIRMPKL